MRPAENKENILVVDDSPETLEVLQRNLSSQGYRVMITPAIDEAVGILEESQIDLVITDLKMPGSSGLDLIRYVRENFKDTEVMMITGYASIEGAVEAVKTGAEEYLSKPFTDEELFTAVRRVLGKLQMRRAIQAQTLRTPKASQGLIGESESMKKIFHAIAKASSTTATVLITGESGTGKELVARAIHYSSPRSSAPFVPVNCGGIPEGLLESELFGHVKGAFTGATESRAGFFQTADRGSIFLDEISEMGLAMQVKLLRVLQDKEVCMVGASRTRKVDVRIIAATNKVLLSLVKKGLFREDLFFRLNVITIEIPPLRDRDDDILHLTRYFAEKFAAEFDKPVPIFSEKALQILKSYHWPGNIRELENVVHRMIVMVEEDIIDAPDLPSLMRYSVPRGKKLNRTLEEVEREHIQNVLARVNGNKTQAARILGINRKTLRERLKKFEMEE